LELTRDDIAVFNRGIWTMDVSVYDFSSGHFYFGGEFELEVRGTQLGDI
jgi:hypothetical protein